MKRFISLSLVFVTVFLCVITYPQPSLAYIDAKEKINIIQQNSKKYENLKMPGHDFTVAYGGCGLFSMAHAIQWLTGKMSDDEVYDLISSFVDSKYDTPGEAIYDVGKTKEGMTACLNDYVSKNKNIIYHKGTFNYKKGGNLYIPTEQMNVVKEIFDKGDVIISNPAGHYVLAVGYKYDKNGNLYIQIVDSSTCSTIEPRASKKLHIGYAFDSMDEINADWNIKNVKTVYTSKDNYGENYGASQYWIPWKCFSGNCDHDRRFKNWWWLGKAENSQNEPKPDNPSTKPDVTAYTKYETVAVYGDQYWQLIGNDGNLREYPYEEAEPIKTAKTTQDISKLTEDDVFELTQVVENTNNERWAEFHPIGDSSKKYFVSQNQRWNMLYQKVCDVNFKFQNKQNDIKIIPFADAANKEEHTAGKMYYAVARYTNMYGNTWYGVAKEAGGTQIGYVNENNILTDESLIDISVSQQNIPSGTLPLGESFPIKGKIETNTSIYGIKAFVISQTTGEVVASASCFPNVNKKVIYLDSDVNGHNINREIKFGNLPEDYYYFTVDVLFGYAMGDSYVLLDGGTKTHLSELSSHFQIGNPENKSSTTPNPDSLFLPDEVISAAFMANTIDDNAICTITWLDDTGEVIEKTEVKYGTIPSHDAPIKESVGNTNFIFSGWAPGIVAATGNATYQAVFSEAENSFTITWKNEDGTIIDTTSVEAGTVPNHAEPQKEGTAEIGYAFSGWEPTVVAATGNAEYKATFTQYSKQYSVTWKNADGTILGMDVLGFGTMPTYAGETPRLESSSEFPLVYTFKGWEPEIKKVTENITYTAVYQEIWDDGYDNPQEEEPIYYTYSGSDQNYEKASSEEKTFVVKRTEEDEKTFALFTGIQVDGVNVGKENYEAVQGSVKITLKPAYLDTLAVGDHILSVLFTDGKDDIPFTVSAAETPVKPIDPTKFADVAVPSDSFTFKKVWEGDYEKSIDFTLYKADGSVYHHGFDKKIVSNKEWKYNAWFSAPAACYVIEQPIPGYITRYVNVGVYADITDRCCDGGTIINKKIPKTGDEANPALWAGMVLAGAAGITTVLIAGKRKKKASASK